MSKSNGTQEIDTSGWMRREEVAKKLGVSLPALTRLQSKEKLNPVVVEGVNFYDPEEVHEVFLEKQKERELLEKGPSKGSVEAYIYETMRAMVGLVREPREKIDIIQFDIIKDLRARVKELEVAVDAGKKAVEIAEDKTSERNMALEQLKSEQRIKETAMGRMVTTVGKLVESWSSSTAKPDVQFTPAQWEMLLTANKDGEEPFLTPDQVKIGETALAKVKQAENGKAAVKNVATAVASTVVKEGASDQS